MLPLYLKLKPTKYSLAMWSAPTCPLRSKFDRIRALRITIRVGAEPVLVIKKGKTWNQFAGAYK